MSVNILSLRVVHLSVPVSQTLSWILIHLHLVILKIPGTEIKRNEKLRTITLFDTGTYRFHDIKIFIYVHFCTKRKDPLATTSPHTDSDVTVSPSPNSVRKCCATWKTFNIQLFQFREHFQNVVDANDLREIIQRDKDKEKVSVK